MIYRDFYVSFIGEESNKLKLINENIQNQIKNYFREKMVTVATLANSKDTQQAFLEFNRSFNNIENEHIDIDMDKLKKMAYKFANRVDSNVSDSKLLQKYLPKSFTGKVLQQLYIANNSLYINNRWELLTSNTNIDYDEVHKKYHLYFYQLKEKYDFYDMFLIDENGNIIYTVIKERDFGTNLKDGIFSNSNFGELYKRYISLNIQNSQVLMSKFDNYLVSNNDLAGFLIAPIFINNKRVGAIAVQIGSRAIDNLLYKNGLNIYLVNQDQKVITDDKHEKITMSVIQQAFKNGYVSATTKNYQGQNVLGIYQRIDIESHKFILAIEISIQDIEKHVQQFFFIIFYSSLKFIIIIFLLSVGAIFWFIIRPIESSLFNLKKSLSEYKDKLLDTSRILDEYQMAIDKSSLVSKTDPEGIILYANSSFCNISGYTKEELIGQPHNIVRHPDMPKETFREMWETIQNKRVWKGIIKNRRKDGGYYYVNSTVIPILDNEGEIKEYLAIRSDITEVMQQRTQIMRQTIDNLTHLPNRQKLIIDLKNHHLEIYRLAIIELDNFREIKDFYGIDIINRVILNIVDIFKVILIQDGINLYHIDEFEFALLQIGNFENDFLPKIENLIRYFDHNIIKIENIDFNISITIGVSKGDATKVIFNTEFALRQAIKSNRNLVVLNNIDNLEDDFRKNIEMTAKIKRAISNGNIVIFGQEIVSNFDKLPYKKYEVLIRMVDGDKILSPFFFLDIAKKARLYPTLTRIVIEKSFSYFRDREDEFSINLNMEDILNSEIIDTLRREIINNSIGHRVILELVESERIENFETIHKFINDFKALGCRIAVDDFGTGYSNFEYLMKLDIDIIKIDGSLIKNIDRDINAQLVVKLIADFAKSKGIQTVGEFVDRESVLQKLKEIGVDYSQGFYLAKPEQLI